MRDTHAQAITTVHEERKVRSTRANVSHRMRTRFRDGCMHVSVRVKRGLSYPFTDEPRPVQDPRDMMLGHACRTTFRLDERPSALPRPEPKRPGKRRRLYTLR
jgi:hypothetical protein